MNDKVKINRIYHPYWLWEDYKFGFYNNCSGEEKKKLTDKCLELFNSEALTKKWMLYVIENWKYSCEHNLTNDSMNKIAYIGQAACCAYSSIPNTVTMEAWSMLSKEVRDRSDKIATDVIKKWYNRNKKIQLCLNLN
jgi:hypothetical protein